MRAKRHSFEVILVLFVFCIYAAGSLFLCVMGATTYRDTTSIMQKDYDLRTGVMYLAEKTRQSDVAGSIRVEHINGADALVLTEQETGKAYETWIFVHEGTLSEEFIASGAEVQLTANMLQKIMPMEHMDLNLDSHNILNIELVTADGTHSTMRINLKSEGSAYHLVAKQAPEASQETPDEAAAPSPKPAAQADEDSSSEAATLPKGGA